MLSPLFAKVQITMQQYLSTEFQKEKSFSNKRQANKTRLLSFFFGKITKMTLLGNSPQLDSDFTRFQFLVKSHW